MSYSVRLVKPTVQRQSSKHSLVREARRRAGLTAEQASTLLGVTVGTLYRWERGDAATLHLHALAALYGVPVDSLIEEEAA